MSNKPIPLDTLLEQVAGRLQLVYREDPARAMKIVLFIIDHLTIPESERRMRQTYTIEVKINFDDDDRHKVMFHLMRKAARQIVGQVQLLADNPNRPAEVMFQTADFYEGGTQHTLANLPELGEEFDAELKDEDGEEEDESIIVTV